MRLVTFLNEDGIPQVGVVRGEQIANLSKLMDLRREDYILRTGAEASQVLSGNSFDMIKLIASAGDPNSQYADLLGSIHTQTDGQLQEAGVLGPLDNSKLCAPILRPPTNVLCLGKNYADHAAESNRARGEQVVSDKPDFPNIFTKATTSINGPYADIPFDKTVSTQIDWEGELAIVVGKKGKNISQGDAFQYIFGYMVLNDVTARDLQKRHGGQFFKGKSLDGACPMGPWIVTADEVLTPQDLDIEVRVNGVVKQEGNTGSMLFSIPEIIEQLSIGMTLEPGDVIATGTPSGVGFARNPPEFLKPGDVVECSIEGLGTIRNTVHEAR